MLRGSQYLLASKGGQDFILIKMQLLGDKYIKEKYVEHSVILFSLLQENLGVCLMLHEPCG